MLSLFFILSGVSMKKIDLDEYDIDINDESFGYDDKDIVEVEVNTSKAANIGFEWGHCIISAIVIVVILLTFVFRLVNIDGSSMLPTLTNSDKVIITNFFYEPEVGDIVVIPAGKYHDEPIIKRIIALEGQDVYIYISSGPDVTTALMLHVVGKDKDHALELLDAKGFKKVRTVTVESDEPAGMVVYQSEEAGLEIDVLTEIILEISAGPRETEPEETEPQPEETEPQPEPTETQLPVIRRNVTFDLPQMEVAYTLSILQDGVQVISGISIAPGTDSFAAEFSGAGLVTFDLYVDGSYHSSIAEEFVDG